MHYEIRSQDASLSDPPTMCLGTGRITLGEVS